MRELEEASRPADCIADSGEEIVDVVLVVGGAVDCRCRDKKPAERAWVSGRGVQ